MVFTATELFPAVNRTMHGPAVPASVRGTLKAPSARCPCITVFTRPPCILNSARLIGISLEEVGIETRMRGNPFPEKPSIDNVIGSAYLVGAELYTPDAVLM